jgi:tetratricopeptide (TPR) repeat protein
VIRRGFGPAAVALVLALGLPAHAAGSDDVAYARATALARDGRCAEALGVLAGITTQTAQTVNLRAQCQLEAKDWPAALASLEEVKRLDPSTPQLELRLAIARFHMGDYAGAEEALDQAAPTAQNDPQYHLYRGLVLLQAARSAEAARELARARAIGPDRVEPGASYYEGLAWAGAEDTEQAREALDRVIATAPGTPWAAEAERAKANLDRIATGRSDAWGFARAGLEYDDNVRLRGNEVFPDSQGNHDMRAVWLLHGGVELLEGEGWAAGVQGSYYGSSHFDLTDFNEHYPVLGIWYDQRLAEDTFLRLAYDVGYLWYNYDPFLFTNTARVSLFQDWDEAGRTELFATPYKYNYLYSVKDVPDDPNGATSECIDDGGDGDVPGPIFGPACGPVGLNEHQERNRDGWGLATGVEHRLPVAVLETELLGGVAYLRYSARGSEYSYNGVGTWVGTDTALPFEAAFRTAIAYSHLSYRNESTYPDAVAADTRYTLDDDDRHEDRWTFAVELEKYITEAWSASVRYSYTNNNSNVDVFAYDREIIGGYVTYRWNR